MVVIYFSAEQSAWNFKVINCSSEVRELQFKVTILIDDMPEEMVVLPAAHHLELQKYLPVIGRPVLKKQVAREKDGKVLVFEPDEMNPVFLVIAELPEPREGLQEHAFVKRDVVHIAVSCFPCSVRATSTSSGSTPGDTSFPPSCLPICP